MKCNTCGAPVSLEDEFCPYCGALNQAAREHIQAMKAYQADYQQTKTEVMQNAARQSKRHTRMIIIGLLIMINIILFVLQFAAWEISDMLTDRKINAQADVYRKELEVFERDGDYRMLDTYYNQNRLYGAKSLFDFEVVTDMARNLSRVEECCFYLYNEDVRSYYSEGELFEQIASNSVYMLEYTNDSYSEYYVEKGCYDAPHAEAMADMMDRLYALLQTYCHLTTEDIQKLPEMSKQDLLVLIGRRYGTYE